MILATITFALMTAALFAYCGVRRIMPNLFTCAIGAASGIILAFALAFTPNLKTSDVLFAGGVLFVAIISLIQLTQIRLRSHLGIEMVNAAPISK